MSPRASGGARTPADARSVSAALLKAMLIQSTTPVTSALPSFADGYGQCQATVWDDRGRPVALSRQTVVVFG